MNAASTSSSPSALPLPPPSSLVPTIIPASLSYLAIYNPALGPTDETVNDQIVFYTSKKGGSATANEKLRQIGLAQGVVEFARVFASSEGLNSIETQKARIVTVELEEGGWWALAQIDLTCIHDPTKQPPTTEYSSREVSPPSLLLAQLRQAYTQFRFHYGAFSSNFPRLGRTAFCKRLEKWWTRWAWGRWEVMLNGSPIVDVLTPNAIKMAGGKPGREIGRAEREFLNGWVQKQRSKGLIELVVSKFGEPVPVEEGKDSESVKSETTNGGGLWFWSAGKASGSNSNSPGASPQGKKNKKILEIPNVIRAQDGCTFRGTGTLSKASIRDISTYIADLYRYGDESFTITPTGIKRKKRKRRPRELSRVPGSISSRTASVESSPRKSSSTIRPTREDLKSPSPKLKTPTTAESEPLLEPEEPVRGRVPTLQGDESHKRTSSGANAKILNLLAFGWSSATKAEQKRPESAASTLMGLSASQPSTREGSVSRKSSPEKKHAKGAGFLIGFLGDLEAEDMEEGEDDDGRITSRTVWVMQKDGEGEEECRIVVYTCPPFYFTFIFESTTPFLTSPRFYRTIHHQLSPLHTSLLPTSISPAQSALQPLSVPTIPKPPYDLLYSPTKFTLHTTIPPIPEPSEASGWSRVDALHVYTLLLGMLSDTAGDPGERERCARSTRGWGVGWIRLPGGEEGMVVRKGGEEGGGMGDLGRHFKGLIKSGEVIEEEV
ncbi:hypothetical protein RUND412_002687 [Rhizina undulata]